VVSGGFFSVYAESKAFLYDSADDSLSVYNYPLNQFVYHCGKEFKTPDDVNLENSYLLVVMDANECTIGMLNGKKITTLWSKTSYIPGKQRQGGQSANRFQHLRAEALKQWFKTIALKMKEIAFKN
jgi:peptide subunit release factor 1 (eRF1)